MEIKIQGRKMKEFETKEELLRFIWRNIPIAVKPKSKNAKHDLVNVFTSNHALDKVCEHLTEKLFKE